MLNFRIFRRLTMSNQKSITSFFLRQDKRKFTEEVDSQNVNKKFAVGGGVSEIPANTSPKKDPIQNQIDSLVKSLPALSSNIGHSWFLALKDEFNSPYFKTLSDFLVKERKGIVYPPQDEVYSWTNYCKINQVKVIILGQDPYHGPYQAHGIAFSVKKGVPTPPSLVNIFKEVKNDYPKFEIPKHGELIGWAEQGVLMLNASLTVRSGAANSHQGKGWEKLTDAVIKYINSNYKNRVFLLWGASAQKKGSFIDQKKHLVLKTVHPSPLSAHRGFIGCGHFKMANKYLNEHSLPQINWTKLSN